MDTYTGQVSADGPPETRTLDNVTITKAEVGTFGNNAYFFRCNTTGTQVLIDAAADAPRLIDLAQPGLAAIITTHRHADHIGALHDVVTQTAAPTFAGDADADAITADTGVPITTRVAHGDTIPVGNATLEVIALRGHTPGSITLVYIEPKDTQAPGAVPGRAHLFTGDSLFPGGVGDTRKDPQRFTSLINDVTARLFDRFGDDAWVYPGHGGDTTLGVERPHLAEWRARGW
jgi:glyoxylase-like metal-dependent hydrolase (beta-lactamase superfamily II)